MTGTLTHKTVAWIDTDYFAAVSDNCCFLSALSVFFLTLSVRAWDQTTVHHEQYVITPHPPLTPAPTSAPTGWSHWMSRGLNFFPSTQLNTHLCPITEFRYGFFFFFKLELILRQESRDLETSIFQYQSTQHSQIANRQADLYIISHC